jgi:penicillin V acylase-like amidase (Ntn superfamily)
VRELVLTVAKETGFGLTRIVGEMRKLGITISRQTVRRILQENGIDPSPDRTSDSWADFLQQHGATGHLSISDASGDSAILEYLDSKLVIHHGPQYRVMTNSPTYDQQLALNAYWDLIGGDKMLPGTISAADRFVRLSYHLKASPKFKDRDLAVASAFSQIRTISVPLGMSDPDHPNISSTLWRWAKTTISQS